MKLIFVFVIAAVALFCATDAGSYDLGTTNYLCEIDDLVMQVIRLVLKVLDLVICVVDDIVSQVLLSLSPLKLSVKIACTCGSVTRTIEFVVTLVVIAVVGLVNVLLDSFVCSDSKCKPLLLGK